MAFFSFKKKKTEDAPKDLAKKSRETEVVAEVVKTRKPVEGFSQVLLSPRITEKVTFLSETRNVFTFNVSPDATKHTVADAISRLYKVHPTKVRLATVPLKRVFVRGKPGVKRGGRKAYVFLKQGDRIEVS